MKRLLRKFSTLAVTLFALSASAQIYVRDGGVWQEVTDPQVNVSGTPQPIKEGWVRVSGTWQQFYVRPVVTLSGQTISDAGSGFLAAVYVNPDGTVDEETSAGRSQIDTATDWIIPNSAASGPKTYHVRCTVDSGTLSAGGSPEDTWLELGSVQAWVKTDGASVTITLEISDDGGATVLDSGQYTLTLI